MRKSGILLPISSLPSSHGIGAFSESAFKFIDFLKSAGQTYWQILPLGPTGYGDSPYQSFSSFAGNPYFIDLDQLVAKGYITQLDIETFDFGQTSSCVDYGKLYAGRFKLLAKAFEKSQITMDEGFKSFVDSNSQWLEDYALYRALKDHFESRPWSQWPDDIKMRHRDALIEYKEKLGNQIEFYEFIQYMFDEQWREVKAYANNKGIKIIGDLPIYVAYDSADAWANPDLFRFNFELEPVVVAGCPPDAFSMDGQLWGNPIYDWENHKKQGYSWWIKRLNYSFKLYDTVRIDHFRGFDEFYEIIGTDETAANGVWRKGPGYSFFEGLNDQLKGKSIIAEDLGYVTDSVKTLLKKTGYPGMKIMQFAFDSREASDYLPHNYEKNSVVYTGTHDNYTVVEWYEKLSSEDKKYCNDYLGIEEATKEIHWQMIRLTLGSVCDLAIIPMQDYLGLGEEGRMNTPSTTDHNWSWRMSDDDYNDALTKKIKRLTGIYGRI